MTEVRRGKTEESVFIMRDGMHGITGTGILSADSVRTPGRLQAKGQ